MRRKWDVSLFLCLTAAVAGCAAVEAGEIPRKDVEVTVFSLPEGVEDFTGQLLLQQMAQSEMPRRRGRRGVDGGELPGFALVKEERLLGGLGKGVTPVRLRDVAAGIEPDSVTLSSATDPKGLRVVEQNYEYDLASPEAILKKYIDKNLSCLTKQGEMVEGRMASYDGQTIVVRDGAGETRIVERSNLAALRLGEMPEGLVTKPTLFWLLESGGKADHEAVLSYLTRGMWWRADYIVVAARDEKTIGLSGWVTISNQSGAAYPDAKLKLLAGEVHRVVRPETRAWDVNAGVLFGAAEKAAPQFEEKAFFEYHLYTLQRPSTIRDNEVKQIELLGTSGVKVSKKYRYRGYEMSRYGYYGERDPRFGTMEMNKKVRVELGFKNSEENSMGMPLPKGKVRVFMPDEGGELELIGEDSIDHTPKDEEVSIHVGESFDVVGERKQVDFKKPADRVIEESFQVRVRNHRDEKVEVAVEEELYRHVNWEMLKASQDYKKKDFKTIVFPVTVEPNSESAVTYTVRYWWY